MSPSPQSSGDEGWLMEMLSGMWRNKGLGEGQGWEEEDGAFTGCWVLSSRVSSVHGECEPMG